jgi:hypothetical protein
MQDKTVTIDGVECKLFKLTPSKGLPILAKLQKMAGGSVFELIEASQDKNRIYQIIGTAIDKLSDRNSAEDVQALISSVLTSGTIFVQGNKLNHLDDLAAFEDKTDPIFLMISLFKEQICYSFSSFLEKMVGSLPSLPTDQPET